MVIIRRFTSRRLAPVCHNRCTWRSEASIEFICVSESSSRRSAPVFQLRVILHPEFIYAKHGVLLRRRDDWCRGAGRRFASIVPMASRVFSAWFGSPSRRTLGVGFMASCRIASHATLLVGLPASCRIASRGLTCLVWCSESASVLPRRVLWLPRSHESCLVSFLGSNTLYMESWVRVATTGVDLPVSFLLPSVSSYTLYIESFAGVSTIGVGLWVSCLMASRWSSWLDSEFKWALRR
jgi:hypothetical protein